MKKRLVALLLCLVMLISAVSCLSACSQKDEDNTEEGILTKNDNAKTLTMWVVTENQKTSFDKNGNPCFSDNVQKAMDEVEKAISKITKSDHKTNIDIRFLTEDEYYTELERAIKANVDVEELQDLAARALEFYMDIMSDKVNSGEIPYMSRDAITNQFYVDYPEHWPYREGVDHSNEGVNSAAQGDKTFLNEYGVPELKYPDAGTNQVDIIYLSGQQKLIDYIDDGWILPLDEDLAGVGSLLDEYISPALLQGVQYKGATYAIPNNIAIGEYTYMLIDKELYDHYGYGAGFDADSNVGLADCKSFLDDVAANTDIIPVASSFNEAMSHYVWYWNVGYGEETDSLGNTKYTYPIGDGASFSVYGSLYGNAADATRGKLMLGFTSLLADSKYQNILKTLKSYEFNGYYGTPSEGEYAAVSYVKGNYSIRGEALENDGVYTDENGHEYYVSVVKYPEVGDNELYGNMFAICSATVNSYASMQVITALNTDSKIRNILQYGVEGEHYQIGMDGVLERKALNASYTSNEKPEYYLMDIEKTGNCFVAHPEEGLPEDYWEQYKVQNGEAVINPLLGFDFASNLEAMGTYLSSAELSNVAYANNWAWTILESMNNIEDYENAVSELGKVLSSDAELSKSPLVYLAVKKFTNPSYTSDGGELVYESPNTVYYRWATENGYLPS